MSFLRVSKAMLAVSLLSSGCNRIEPAPPPPPPPSAKTEPTGRPQPKLATIKLWLGAQEVIAEQAMSEMEIQTGMMFRKEMAENEGMLFIFPGPYQAKFWMRNTLLPLTCAYIDSQGKILETHDMKPLDETPIEAGSDKVQYVLEMKQGWFDRNRVNIGVVVRTEKGSLSETYFGKSQ